MANRNEIVVELTGFSISPTQRKAIADAVKGVVVERLSINKKDAVLVRPTIFNEKATKIAIGRVLNGANR